MRFIVFITETIVSSNKWFQRYKEFIDKIKYRLLADENDCNNSVIVLNEIIAKSSVLFVQLPIFFLFTSRDFPLSYFQIYCILFFQDVPANISGNELKSVLENNFKIGQVSVSRVGTCASHNWTVEWVTTGGDQPTIAVNGTGLTGNKVSIKASTIDDGGLFLRPIPGDMLRAAENKPQVKTKFYFC